MHIYRDASDILIADRHFIAVHTGPNPATDTLHLPRKTTIYDVFARKLLVPNADAIKLNVPARSTALFHLGDAGPFRAAVENREARNEP